MTHTMPALSNHTRSEELYLELMKHCLTRLLWKEKYRPIDRSFRGWRRALLAPMKFSRARNEIIGADLRSAHALRNSGSGSSIAVINLQPICHAPVDSHQ